ncbi:MAG: ribulose-phosphate 3-epimerase [Patescibacteria group bacterium]
MQFLKKDPTDIQFAAEIVPAILETTFAEVKRKIELVEGVVKTAQVDLMDGIFVPAYTWPYEDHTSVHDSGETGGDIDDIEKLDTKVAIELHCMMVNPEEVLHEWLTHGVVKRVLIHPESTTHLDRALEIIRDMKRQAGLSLNLSTPIESIAPYMDRVTHVQLMSIEKVGFGGQPFAEDVLPRIQKLRAMFPHVTISVDGGISEVTAPKVLKAGADILVAGSALFKAQDIKEAAQRLQGVV